ncbi:MAG: hypothetical protein K8W52_03170 [Deltaproteobacteria bacterium]|nr:hypothetical protein [Deltaproteobacteria bacterium]
MSFAELKTKPIRAAAIAAASVSACLLVYASMSLDWLVYFDPDDHSSFGLRTVRQCFGDTCTTQGLAAMLDDAEKSGTLASVGWVVSIAQWVAAAALLLAGGLAVVGKFVLRPVPPTSVAALASIVALISTCLFIAVNPARPEFQAGNGFWFGGVGAIGGLLASIFIARQRTPDWDETPPVDEDNW